MWGGTLWFYTIRYDSAPSRLTQAPLVSVGPKDWLHVNWDVLDGRNPRQSFAWKSDVVGVGDFIPVGS